MSTREAADILSLETSTKMAVTELDCLPGASWGCTPHSSSVIHLPGQSSCPHFIDDKIETQATGPGHTVHGGIRTWAGNRYTGF